MYLPGMAWLILPQTWFYQIPVLGTLFRPWRLLMIIYALPSIVFSIITYFLPESPKYLLTQGKKDEVLEILKRIYVINSGKDPNNYPVSAILWEEDKDVTHKKNEGILASVWEQTRPLFQKVYLVKSILVCYLQFAIFFT